MLFSKPIPFTAALAYRKAQKILPTSAGSAEIEQLDAQIRERALFSAKTTDAGYLGRMDKLLTKMTSPVSQYAAGGTAIDPGTFRLQMRDELAKLGYVPDRPGSLQDLGSDARLNLIVDMQLQSAYGYGNHVAGQNPDIVDLWPCQELVRVMSRKNPRGDGQYWYGKWTQEGGTLHEGRMIARKDDSIWTRISRFGTPYPPFDYNSGMGLRDVRRDEAQRLGIIKPSTVVKPDDRKFTQDVEADMPTGISSGLLAAVKAAFIVQAGKLVLGAAQ